jgi:hypothetical protein
MRPLLRQLKSGFLFWILLISTLIVPSMLLIRSTTGLPQWWDPNWNFRKLLEINSSSVKADLENFPVLIDIFDQELAAKAKTNGSDIFFVDGSGNTLDREIELFDRSSGHLVAWVRIPFLSSTSNTEFCMYYGNANPPASQNSSAVWDSGFVMVQHLEELSGVRFDSTVNGNNATVANAASVFKDSSGKIDGADNFTGAVGGYESVQQGFLPSTAITVELWFKPTSYSPSIWTKFINTGSSSVGGIYGGQNSKTQDAWIMGLAWNSGAKSFSTSSIASGYSWNCVAITWNGSYCYAYLNGLQVKEGAFTGTPDWLGRPLYLGSNYWGGERFNGSLDEIRISNVSRSAAWLQTCYNNQKYPSTFCIITGSEEAHSLAPLIFDETPMDESASVYTNPTLSVHVVSPQSDPMTIVFLERVLGSWVEIARFSDVPDGNYSAIPRNMTSLGTTYYWSVTATDLSNSTSKTFSLTTTNKVLQQKWLVSGSPIPLGVAGVLAADVNNDTMEEIFSAGIGSIVCLNPISGNVIWNVSDNGIGMMAKPQMADLDLDGTLEIVVPLQSPAGALALHANNGSLYWRIVGLGRETYSSPVVFDVDGDGHPEIFMGSTDVYQGLNGTGRLTKLSYDGKILQQTFVWRPCGGGLSIADADGDGEFELYMGDRFVYEPDNDYGKGVQSYWAGNLTLRWFHPDVVCSSHIPMLADVNKDGVLEVVVGHLDGGVAVLNSTDGTPIRETTGIPLDAPVHYQPSVYDIDGDGNLEMLMADLHNETSDDLVIWDLVKWQIDARLYIGKCFYGPQIADVNGDGLMEIIACNLKSIFIIDRNYRVIDAVTGLSGNVSYKGQTFDIDGVVGIPGTLNYAVVQDTDNDGYNELVVSTQSGAIYAFDTPARRPTLRPRTEVQFYSEYRRGVAEYVKVAAVQEPIVFYTSPANRSAGVPISLSTLQFTLTDYQFDPLSYLVRTSPDIGSNQTSGVSNGKYSIAIHDLTPSTTYTWTIDVTDGTHWTNVTSEFTTESVSPWWNTGWNCRKRLVIDHNKVGSDLSTFPVLVDMTDSDLANKARTDGGDIAFADANGNGLNWEIEKYDSPTGHLVAWVNVPLLSSISDTSIFMYYSGSIAQNLTNPSLVWDSGFSMVQHLEEQSGVRVDSTANGNNATVTLPVLKDSSGRIDGADNFTGGYERVQQGFLPSAAITVELWFKPTSYSPSIWTKFINTGSSSVGGIYGGQNSKTQDAWIMGLTWNSGTKSFSTPSITSGYSWNYVAITWNGAYCYAYLNGLQVKEGAFTGTPDWLGRPLYLGSNYWGSERFNGSLDEIRISNVSRSAAWLQTCYNNQKYPSSFCTIGTEEAIPQVPVIFAPSPSDKAVNVPRSISTLAFNLSDYQDNSMSYTVTTYPDIGSDAQPNVNSGRFILSVSNLQYFTTYHWTIKASDGTHWTNITYSFTVCPTEAPTQDVPILVKDLSGSITCKNQTTKDPDGDSVANIYTWYQNNTPINVLHLPFDTNSSTAVKDYSGYNNNGMIVGSVAWTQNGIVGGAYQFKDGFIQIPGTSVLDGNGAWSEITIEHWIYLTSNITRTRTIARFPSYEIGIRYNRLFAGVWIVTGNPETSGYSRISYDNYTLLTNTWYHVAMTYKSGTGLTLYVNGTAVMPPQMVTGVIEPAGSNPLYMGWFDPFQGKMDEVKIYPKCLSSQQIAQDYLGSKDGLSNSSTIVSQEIGLNDTWRCEVTPNDSHQDGTTRSSNTIMIGSNNQPIITSFYPQSDLTLYRNQTQDFNVTFFDPDEDSLVVEWWINDSLVQNQTAFYFSTYFLNGTELSAGTYQINVIIKDRQTQTSHQWTIIMKEP